MSRTVLLFPILALACSTASADVSISNKPTQNMSCEAGVCTATAQKAVLNVGDLQAMLASADVTVKTGSLSKDIDIDQPLTWASTNRLTFDAQHSVIVKKPMTITGTGGLTITVSDGGKRGEFTIEQKGSVHFWDQASVLVINGISYKLVSDIAALAADVADSPGGAYALASNYDATKDGQYSAAPIEVPFSGTFLGLGNNILNLHILDEASGHNVGLFATSSGLIADVRLIKARVQGRDHQTLGGLVGSNSGTLSNDYASGAFRAAQFSDGTQIGALAGYSTGHIVNSMSSGKVTLDGGNGSVGGLVGSNDQGIVNRSGSIASVACGPSDYCGGLIGLSDGPVSNSHTSGMTFSSGGSVVGGLIGDAYDAGTVTLSYAVGTVVTGEFGTVGGLVGGCQTSITSSFATGPVSDGSSGGDVYAGGLVGYSNSSGVITNSYATGAVSVYSGEMGGLAGHNTGKITSAYSTGHLASRGGAPYVGGLVGYDNSSAGISNAYWDLGTSGVSDPAEGAGYPSNDPGITGLTTDQFKSELPNGFDSKIWGEKKRFNNGYPYLLANPPQ
jgi:hypothetical protein